MASAVWGLVLACGKSEEIAPGVDAAMLSVGSAPMLSLPLRALEDSPAIDAAVAVVPRSRMEETRRMVRLFGLNKTIQVVAGGARWPVSLKAGLLALGEAADLVVVQQVTRIGLTPALLAETIKAARKSGCAWAARSIDDPVRWAPGKQPIPQALPAGECWETQGPLVCRVDLLRKALEKVSRGRASFGLHALDFGKQPVTLVPSSKWNLRITGPEDLKAAEILTD